MKDNYEMGPESKTISTCDYLRRSSRTCTTAFDLHNWCSPSWNVIQLCEIFPMTLKTFLQLSVINQMHIDVKHLDYIHWLSVKNQGKKMTGISNWVEDSYITVLRNYEKKIFITTILGIWEVESERHSTNSVVNKSTWFRFALNCFDKFDLSIFSATRSSAQSAFT